MTKNIVKSELLCVASKLLEEQLEAEELSACESLSKEDLGRLLKENTIETTKLPN